MHCFSFALCSAIVGCKPFRGAESLSTQLGLPAVPIAQMSAAGVEGSPKVLSSILACGLSGRGEFLKEV